MIDFSQNYIRPIIINLETVYNEISRTKSRTLK